MRLSRLACVVHTPEEDAHHQGACLPALHAENLDKGENLMRAETTSTTEKTEGWVFERLVRVFPQPAFILLPQVRNQTGFDRQVRTIDALAVSVFPSRGLYFVGIEIKITLADWRRELAHPEKADSIQKYCRHWYVAAPDGVVPEAEVPETWGLIEVNGRSAKIARKAPALEHTVPDARFVCAVLRAATSAMVPAAVVQDQIKMAVTSELNQRRGRERHELDSLRHLVEEFEKNSGVDIRDKWNIGEIGAAVRMLVESGAVRCAKRIAELRATAEHILDAIDRAGKMVEDRDEMNCGPDECPTMETR